MNRRSQESSHVRDALLEILGDDAFGSIYEHHGGRRRSRAPRENVVSARGRPGSSSQPERKKRDSTGIRSAGSDEEWSAEKDLEKARSVVKARRRLLVSRNVDVNRNASEGVGQGHATVEGLAALAAQAGANASMCSAGFEDEPNDEHAYDDPEDNHPSSSSPSSSPTPKKKAVKRKQKAMGSSRTRREASGVLINGKMVHSISGVPDEFLLDMASLPQAQRPKKCGQCGSCLNPIRKKACEVMRALGTNPPIPRGKNREKLLGTANSKKHVPRSFGSADADAPDVTKLEHRGAEDDFTFEELQRLQQALVEIHPNINRYWAKVAQKVGTKDEQACFQRVYQSDAYYAERCKPKTGTKGNGNASGHIKGGGNGGDVDDGDVHGDVGDVAEDGFIERVLQRRRVGLGDGDGSLPARRSGDIKHPENKLMTLDHAKVRTLVENELAEMHGDAEDSSETESEEF